MSKLWHCATCVSVICGLTACGAEPLADAGDADAATAQDTSAALLGRVDDGFPEGSQTQSSELCHPFALTYLDRTLTKLTAATRTSAFGECVADAFADTVIPCPSDPNFSLPLASQATMLVEVLRAGTHLKPMCDPDYGTDCAPALGHGHEQTTSYWLSEWWTRQTWDQYEPYGPGQPFGSRAAAVAHEYLHTHDYGHPPGDCAFPMGTEPNSCDDPACAWTSVCGGDGRIPRGTSYDASARDARNRCSVLAGLSDGAYHARRASNPTPMQQAEGCVEKMLVASATSCASTTCSDPDDTVLLSTYSRTSNSFGGNCVCVPKQRHAASLVAGSGHFLTALGGEGSLLTAAGIGRGDWQTFYLTDFNGGALAHGDVVSIRVGPNDTFLAAGAPGASVRADALSDSGASAQWRIQRKLGAGPVRDGDVIGLINVARSRFLTAVNDGGGQVVSDAPALRDWEELVYREPRRAHLVQLQTHDTRYVSYYPTSSTEVSTAGLTGEFNYTAGDACTTDEDCHGERSCGTASSQAGTCWFGTCLFWEANPDHRRQSFWIVDHNGGQLLPGDSVSFESSVAGNRWSTCTSGTGNLRGNSNYDNQACQRFTIARVDGSGPIVEGTQVTLRSAQGKFLSAIPSGFPNAFRVRNEATSPRAWEQFKLLFAQGSRF